MRIRRDGLEPYEIALAICQFRRQLALPSALSTSATRLRNSFTPRLAAEPNNCCPRVSDHKPFPDPLCRTRPVTISCNVDDTRVWRTPLPPFTHPLRRRH